MTVSYQRSGKPLEAQVEELRAELARISFEGAAGFDPDAAGKGLFRAFKASVGSATLIVVDRDGNLAWFQQDPRGADVDFAKAILLRLAGQAEQGRP